MHAGRMQGHHGPTLSLNLPNRGEAAAAKGSVSVSVFNPSSPSVSVMTGCTLVTDEKERSLLNSVRTPNVGSSSRISIAWVRWPTLFRNGGGL